MIARLDFRRALPDAIDAHVAIQPLHRVLAHIAAPAENLHRLVEHAAGHFGRLELQRARPRMDELAVDAVVDLPRYAIDEALGRHDLDRHVGEHELDRLKIADGAAELTPLARPGVGEFEGADRGAQRIGRDLQPRLDEPVLGQLEAAADGAENPVLADLDILEHELGMAEHVGMRELGLARDADARRRLVDEKQGRLVGIAVDIGVDDDVVGDVAGGHEPFLAVEDEASVAAVGAGARSCAGRSRRRAR